MTSFNVRTRGLQLVLPLVLLCSLGADGQQRGGVARPAPAKAAIGPKVTQIDQTAFSALLKPNGKPLLINFWATWCEPCREEFPDLVKIDSEFKGRIDFITVSLDFVEDLNTAVPKFLSQMKAEMPAYLLVTPDETAAIAMVSKEWQGGLPFTVLFAPTGEIAYSRQGIVRPEVLRAEIGKLLTEEK